MKKLFASDYDGTLFFHRPYSQEDVEAVRAWQKEGNAFVLNTGRGHRQVMEHYHFPDHPLNFDLMIYNSGAVITDGKGEILVEHPIPWPTVKRVALEFAEAPLSASVDGDFLLRAHPFFSDHFPDALELKEVPSIEDMKGKEIHSLSLHFDTVERTLEAAEELKAMGLPLGIHVNRTNIDLNVPGFDKASGLQEAAKRLESSETYAIGDSYNDLPALLAADHGFLMSNANESLKQIAKENGIQIVDSVAQAIHAAMQDEE